MQLELIVTLKKDLKALTGREIVSLKVCPNCGRSVERTSSRGPTPYYCSRACSKEQKSRDAANGGAIIRFAKAWRAARGQGPVGTQSFAAMIAALDVMLEAERAQGKPSPIYAAAALLEQGMSYKDRRPA